MEISSFVKYIGVSVITLYLQSLKITITLRYLVMAAYLHDQIMPVIYTLHKGKWVKHYQVNYCSDKFPNWASLIRSKSNGIHSITVFFVINFVVDGLHLKDNINTKNGNLWMQYYNPKDFSMRWHKIPHFYMLSYKFECYW